MSRSVKQDYERYRRPRPVTLYQCFECATCTTNLPDMSGVALCDRHKAGNLLFCQEVHSEFRNA